MDKVTHIHNGAALQEQASVWLSKIDRGLDAAERTELEQWLQTSKQHRQTLFQMAELWDSMTMLSELSELFPLEQQATVAKSLWKAPIAVAASIFTIALGGLIVSAGLTPDPAYQESFATAVGEQQQHQLPDGSTIQVNTDTSIRVEFSAKQREIFLDKGEVLFTVAPNKQKPFVVHAGEHTVTAVGTAFNVQMTAEDDFEVIVTEGKVELATPAAYLEPATKSDPVVEPPATTLLLAGDKVAVVEQQIDTLEQLPIDEMQDELAWQVGFLVFDGEPLSEAIDEVSRYTNTNIQIADKSLYNIEIAGYFKTNDVNELLAALERNFNIAVERTNSGDIRLSRQ